MTITSAVQKLHSQTTIANSNNTSSKSNVQATSTESSYSYAPHDKVEINGNSTPEKPNTYSKPTKLSSEEIDSILAESKRKSDEFMNLIRGLVTKQGLDFNLVVRGEQKLTVEDPKMIEDAKAAIADDGEYGVKKMAENILSFAKSLIGGDSSKLEMIRDSIEKGFAAAKEVLGGVLPEISNKTYDAIMKELDRWQSEGIPDGDVQITIS